MSTNVTTTPDAALVELAQHDDHLVRAYAAGHPDTSVATLWMLAADEHPVVRGCVAANQRTSQRVLSTLAADPQGDVRNALVRNPSTSDETLAGLLDDEYWGIRRQAFYGLRNRGWDVLWDGSGAQPPVVVRPNSKRDQ